MTTGTPLTTTTLYEPVGAELVPPSPGQYMPGKQGVGVGVGSKPPVSGGPADADENSAQVSANTSTQNTNKRLIGVSVSPLVVVSRSGFAAKTPQDTPIDPALYAQWRALISDGNFEAAAGFCRERLLVARDERERVCWVKDLAISRRIAGDYEGAYDLHLSIASAAAHYEGSFRARIENGFARSNETLTKYDSAFGLYTAARYYAEQSGDHLLCAQIDTNTGRCYTAAGHPESSHSYFDRALQVAESHADLLLQGEIFESVALAFEAEGKCEDGFEAAAKSVAILAPTNFEAALKESLETRARLARMRGQR